MDFLCSVILIVTEVVEKKVVWDFLFSILKPSDRILPFFGGNWRMETDTAAFEEKMLL